MASEEVSEKVTVPNAEKKETAPPPLFLDIGPNVLPTELDSICFKCMEQGKARILLTKIPYFREVMISRFECPHCGASDNSIQFAGEYPAKGVHFELRCNSADDLDRRIVKSCHGTITIPQLDLEIPGPTQGDSISTIQGVLEQSYTAIREQNPEPSPKIAEFLDNLEQCWKGLVQFDLILDDPSGNSFIENPKAPEADPLLTVKFYRRTPEQSEAIGLVSKPQTDNFEIDDESTSHIQSVFADDQHPPESVEAQCPVCSTQGEMRSCHLTIPHFKEIILMAFSCKSCGYHNGEVMVGGAISSNGARITLHADTQADLNREVIKSDLASIAIPECDIDMIPGTLGGKFTTVEGLLRDMYNQLKDNNPFTRGDSALAESVQKYDAMLRKLKGYWTLEEPFTLILDDSLANSFIQKLDENDTKVVTEPYERSFEQNEVLGLNDIKTENYE